MSRCFIRLLVVFVAALAAVLAPLSSNAAMDVRRTDCCEHTTHRSDHCADCIVCVAGLNCVLPSATPPLPDSVFVIARFPGQTFAGETRTDPPPLPPPRIPA